MSEREEGSAGIWGRPSDAELIGSAQSTLAQGVPLRPTLLAMFAA